MPASPTETRIIEHPFASLLQGGRLDSFQENGREILLQVQGLELTASEVFEREGKLLERVTGRHVPLKLTFLNVSPISRDDFFTTLEQYPPDDPSRTIITMHSWKQPGMDDIFHALSLRGPVGANMSFFASEATHEKAEGGNSFTFERDWSPAPPMPDRVVPQLVDLYPRFGGDPVFFRMNENVIENKLFVGGLEHQPDERPQELGAVLNLGERPSLWVKGDTLHPSDRTVERGEGLKGMSVNEIREEANWVIDHLKKDESVLIHCVAGMNRSTTVCCAVLMLLENLSADEALIRVREQHPWAKPDSYHWLALRWLEKMAKE
jgi:Dual specificity phosphatase, catalytic domain